MKSLVKVLMVFLLLITSAQAVTFEVLVLPVDILNKKENYYGFDEVSQIVAADIIKDFNNSGGKIKSPDLYEVSAELEKNPQLKEKVLKTLDKYKNSKSIDYAAFKTIGNNFSCKSVLIVSSFAVTNKNSLKRGVWEVLDISSAINASYPYRLETSVVLLDTVNDLVLWSNNYSAKLGSNSNFFAAKNYAQANAEYEKIKLYSQTVVAPGASQNIMLRFFPKSVKPVLREIKEDSGGALRYERNLPEMPKDKMKPRENFYGDMIYGI